MRVRTLAVVAVGALVLGGCGGDGDETAGGDGATTAAPDDGGATTGDDGGTSDEGAGTSVPDRPEEGVTADQVKLGWMGDLTGPTVAAQGLNFAGSEAAVAWFNENGGVLGRELVLVERDDQYAAEAAATNYSALVDDDQVLALLNMGGSHISTALLPDLEADGIALIGPAQTIDAQLASDNVFNNLAHYGDQADVAVAYMGEQLGSVADATVAVVHLEVPSGAEWATYIQSEVEEGDGTFAGAIPLNPGAPDYAGTVTRLQQLVQNEGVNFVAFHASPAQALGLATEMAGRGVDVPVVGIQGIAASSVYEEGPPEAAGQFFGVHSFLPPASDCEMCTTMTEFVAGTDWEDEASEINFTHGWLDVMIAVQAIERAAEEEGEVTRATVLEALRGPFETGGLTCDIDWSEDNHSPCAAPFGWDESTGQLAIIGDFSRWADAIDGEYGLFEG